MIDFSGHTILVTGAGRGLGRSHALLLASLGANIVMNDASLSLDGSRSDDDDAIAQTVTELEAHGHGVLVSNHDVTDPAAVDEMVAQAVDTFGGLQGAICNAGFVRDRSLVNLTDEDLRSVIDVHLLGSALVARAAMRVFRESNFGRIVMTTSGAGLYGNPGQSNYAAGKMGIVGLTKVLAIEGSRSEVKVNVVAPAAMTRMTESLQLGRVADHLDPTTVSALFALLCSSECPTSGEIFEAGAGTFRRVVIGATPGWFCGVDGRPTPGDLLAHWDEILDPAGLVIPPDAVAANKTLFDGLLQELRR